MLSFALLAVLTSMPQPQDLEPPAAALTGPSSTRLAMPITLRFDELFTDDVSALIKKGSGAPEGASREPVWAVARFGPSIARRHFEQATWGGKGSPRAVVVKSISVVWSDGPRYEVKVVVDRYEGARRIGQASGSGWGIPDRRAQRAGAAWAGPFGGIVRANANEAKGEEDGLILRSATVAAFDAALMQLGAVWQSEQTVAQMRAESAAAVKKAQDDFRASQRSAAKRP